MKMRSLLAAVTIIAFGTANAQNAKIESLQIGSSIPAATNSLKSVTGKTVTLNDAKTKSGLLVMFSCNTCPYVIKSQQRTAEVIKYAKEKGIGMVIVNSNDAQRGDADSYEAMTEYAKEHNYTVPYVVDEKSKLADMFGATRTPEVFLFDGSGKLVYKGAMEDNPTDPGNSKSVYIKDAINGMVAGKTVDPNSTKSIGCSIKRSL